MNRSREIGTYPGKCRPLSRCRPLLHDIHDAKRRTVRRCLLRALPNKGTCGLTLQRSVPQRVFAESQLNEVGMRAAPNFSRHRIVITLCSL